MAVFELVIALLLLGAALSSLSRRLRLPYPALLALAGAAIALVPTVPTVILDPRLALALFVAPVLLDSAFDSSPRDMKANWRVVTSLVLVAVGLTIVAVAVVARALVPDLSWAAALTLGAIVAPPDAAAATAVLKQLRPPHRLLVILEGESMFNDASALLVYRLAVGAAVTGGGVSLVRAVPTLAVVCLGSVVLAAALARLIRLVNERVDDVATSVIFQFIGTFGVWILAEGLHLSGIITVVVFALILARSTRTGARVRIPSYAVWEVAVFVLNVLAFILIGMQLKPIVSQLSRPELISYIATAAAICAAVIGVRLAWVISHTALGQLSLADPRAAGERLGARADQRPDQRPDERPDDDGSRVRWRSALVVGWCGMRGIVTLAAALALPVHFPHRDLILFVSFAVVLGTLVIQGGTMSLLMRWLGLEDDGAVTREIHVARAGTARAALASIGDDRPDVDEGERLLRRMLEERLRRAEAAAAAPRGSVSSRPSKYGQGLARAQIAEREALLDLRARGIIGDDAFHRVEEELDWAELDAEGMSRAE